MNKKESEGLCHEHEAELSLFNRAWNYKKYDSDPDSDSEPDGVVDAVYDVVFLAGGYLIATDPFIKSGFTVTIKHVDTYSNPSINIPVRRYKAYMSILAFRAVFSCDRSGYKAYDNFKQLQRNAEMKCGINSKDPMVLDMKHGYLDDNGFPFLKYRMNSTEKTEVKQGKSNYVYREGWAKRREAPEAKAAELTTAEKEKLDAMHKANAEIALRATVNK